MRYDIRLRIGYDYALMVRNAHHILRLSPRTDRAQSLHAVSLRVDPQPDEMAQETCFFGNRAHHLLLNRPHAALAVEMLARVAVLRGEPDLSDGPDRAALVRLARLSRDVGGSSPLFQLPASRLVAPLPAAGDFVRECLAGHMPGHGVLAVARRISTEFTYQQGLTSLATTPAETLASRRGVCQDFAHLMIAGLRQVGIPAAYVSGFLRTDPPPGQPRIEGADAMHAWIEAWLGPQLGWVGFDPTNGCVAGDGHIVVGFGRDYADVAPVAGVVTTRGAQASRHAVDVVPEREAPAPWQAALEPA